MECFEDPTDPGQLYVRLLRQDLLEELVFSEAPGQLVVCMVGKEFLVYRPENGTRVASKPALNLLVRDVRTLLGKRAGSSIGDVSQTSVHIFTDVDLYDMSDELAKELDVRVFCHLFRR